jgi:hypothetical protein
MDRLPVVWVARPVRSRLRAERQRTQATEALAGRLTSLAALGRLAPQVVGVVNGKPLAMELIAVGTLI